MRAQLFRTLVRETNRETIRLDSRFGPRGAGPKKHRAREKWSSAPAHGAKACRDQKDRGA